MAAPDITAFFFDQEEVPMALLFGPETIVPGRRCAISSMGGSFDRVQALEALKAMFPSNLQVIVWKSDTNEPISLESMNFDEMELAVAFRARSEACNILGDSQLEYNNLKAQYLSAINESERVGVLLVMKNLLHNAIFQNLAANALKSYGTTLKAQLDLLCVSWTTENFFQWIRLGFKLFKTGSIGLWHVLPYLEFRMMLNQVLQFLKRLSFQLTVLRILICPKLLLRLIIMLTEHPLED